MQGFAGVFYGRQTAYLAAFTAPDRRELEKALARNIFQGGNGTGPRRLAQYARAVARQFEVLDQEALLCGAIVFPDPEAPSDARAQSARFGPAMACPGGG